MKSLSSAARPMNVDVFFAMPGNIVLLSADAPHFTIVAATEGYFQTSGQSRNGLIGRGLFEVFPNTPDDPEKASEKRLLSSLEQVLIKKETRFLPTHRYDILSADGSFEQRYWSFENKPVLNEEGKVVYLIHSVMDVTDKRKAELREENIKGVQKAYNLFMNAPVIIGILRGDEYIIELANEGLLEVWGRTAEVVGKPLLEAIPELEAQGFIGLLEQVRTTGEPFYAYEYPIVLSRHGREETLYFDFVYKPIYVNGKEEKASGIISVGHDVTKQVKAKQNEQESEAKYRSLFESMDQGFCVLEMIFDEGNQPVDYRFLEANPAFEKQTGLVSAVGKTAKELVPNLEARWFELYGKVALTGEAVSFTEGSEAMGRWFEVYAFHVGKTESHKVALLFTDITEQRRADETIRESEARFRNLADDSPMFVFTIDTDPFAPVSYWNKTWLSYTGQTYEEALGRAWNGILHPEDVPVVMKHYAPAFEKREPYFIPAVRVKRHDGAYRWHAFKGNPRFLLAGQFNGYIGVGFDIHDQKLAEEGLRQSEARTRAAIDIAYLGTFEINMHQQTIIHSHRNAEILGLDPAKQWPYQVIVDTVHPEDRDIRSKAHEEAKRTGELFYEARVIHPDQSIRWVRLNGRYIHQDNTPMIIGTLMDITEERKTAELLEQKVEERTLELQVAIRDLERSNQNLEEFAYAASHDLKEPVRKIHAFSGRLKESLSERLTESERHYFNRMELASIRMGTLIDELLMYSHVSRGAVMEEDIDLNQKVRTVLNDLELEIEEKVAMVTVDPLPVVKGHRRQLQQLFHNLLGNALKYSKPGVPPVIHISCRKVGADEIVPLTTARSKDLYHLIEVKDNGIGFEQEDADRIFNVFTRLHGMAEYKGSGVGLSIVRKVVENHSGYVWAESTPGEGATFRILFPTH